MGEVRLASQAAVPEKPASPRKLLNTAVAGVLGLMVAVFGAFVVEWWQGGTEGEQRGAEGRGSRGVEERGSRGEPDSGW